MRKFMLATAAILGLTVSANAADMPLKAPPVSPAAADYSGWYWALGPSAKVADSTVNGNVLLANLASSNVMAAGGGIDFEFGHISGNISQVGFFNWSRLYAEGTYQNVAGGFTAPGASASTVSRWSAQQGFDINADIVTYVLSAFNWPNPFSGVSPPTLSNIAVAAGPHQYMGIFVTEQGLGGNFGAATGTSWAAAIGARTGWLYETLNTSGKPNGLALDSGLQVAWMPKGITFDNVFAGNTPIAAHASTIQGTTYGVYAHLMVPALFRW